ncbi:SLAM family member 9-like isoform X7 [Myxocyprinus asiaticus]|uniref:SLAM family member 9-like isoform X6 n=1 Tax=Myxocyprinus asiaticus TaxID=70543 RepID=UPI002222D597|nr:SLAM family member 9-like isoform X6 [Myxocyprinus asiaticus]XP_051555788.1 SLAM family member 9-like isoform X7 [Myxocyprinus asiaticus]
MTILPLLINSRAFFCLFAFLKMEVGYQLVTLIIYTVCNTGSSAVISVFVETGSSVTLDIPAHELTKIGAVSWKNEKLIQIVTYFREYKDLTLDSSYEGRVDFNNKTFSLTLKNMQKTDSGVYMATTLGEQSRKISEFKVSVIDAVEVPILKVVSNWSRSDSCTVNFICTGHDLILNSTYQNNRCSPENVTPYENYNLILNCSKESIICNHSNPVSWKTDIKNIKNLCEENYRGQVQSDTSKTLLWTYILVPLCILVTGLLILGLSLSCKSEKGAEESGSTVYTEVEYVLTSIPVCLVGKRKAMPVF